jgi:hypothetical protein
MTIAAFLAILLKMLSNPALIAGLIALRAGERPLRQPVHPDTTVTTAVNQALSDVQDRVLSRGPYGAWRAAVKG